MSDEPKRYWFEARETSMGWSAEKIESETGAYVSHSAYDQLRAENLKLRANLINLVTAFHRSEGSILGHALADALGYALADAELAIQQMTKED